MRAEILTDILTLPGRGTILMRPDTDTGTDSHRETVMTHRGTECHRETVMTHRGTECHRETVMTHAGTDCHRETVMTHREREETDTRAYLHHDWPCSEANLRFLMISFSFLYLCDEMLDWHKNKVTNEFIS